MSDLGKDVIKALGLQGKAVTRLELIFEHDCPPMVYATMVAPGQDGLDEVFERYTLVQVGEA